MICIAGFNLIDLNNFFFFEAISSSKFVLCEFVLIKFIFTFFPSNVEHAHANIIFIIFQAQIL